MNKRMQQLTLFILTNCALLNAKNPLADLNKTLGIVENISADISVLVVDLRYHKGSVKICELGEGMLSRYKGHDAMYGRGTMWSYIWREFLQLRVPFWYVGQALNLDIDKQEVQYSKFPEMNVTMCRNIIELQSCATFKRALTRESYKSDDLTQHRGLAMFRHRSAADEDIQRFRKRNPGILVLDTAIAPFANNKYYTNVLFEAAGLEKYKPRFMLCEKKYRETLAREIIEKMPADRYVIKPLCEFKGRGVVIVEKAELAGVLEKILLRKKIPAPNKVLEQKFNYKDGTFSHWTYDVSTHFLVEEYCSSKTVVVDGKEYDPTMRLALVLRYDKNGMSAKYLDAFWKMPVRSLDETTGSTTEKYKSLGIVPAEVSVEDKQDLYAIFDQFILKLYAKMIATINEGADVTAPPAL